MFNRKLKEEINNLKRDVEKLSIRLAEANNPFKFNIGDEVEFPVWEIGLQQLPKGAIIVERVRRIKDDFNSLNKYKIVSPGGYSDWIHEQYLTLKRTDNKTPLTSLVKATKKTRK